jgi:hypothetical protein
MPARRNALEKQILQTYLFLRVGIAGLAFAFPIILWVGAYRTLTEYGECVEQPLFHGLADSMSAYYYCGDGVMRDWFVGILWAVGVFLILYQGYTVLENVLLDGAGFFAIGIALLPMQERPDLHYICAIAFFACIAAVCVFCAPSTLAHLPVTDRRWYKRWYRGIAAAMLVSIATAYALKGSFSEYKFMAEFCGVYSFAAYWFLKSLEISRHQTERRILDGELAVIDGKVVHASSPRA